jgi:predicted regulator of Ras-like GTPase activity (Roadblock/LC7/MglB family)
MSPSRPPEPGKVARDLDSTGFSSHLDELVRQVPEAICAVFIDGEGETVDLASRVNPFDARIAGAEMSIVLDSIRRSRTKLGEGAVIELRIEGNARSILVRHVAEGYDIVVLVDSASITARVAEATAAASFALLKETGLKPPPRAPILRAVEHRPSRMGILVPTAFEENGRRRRVETILGHRDDGDGLVRFLVRLDDGEELVVVHDRAQARWIRT